MLNKYSINGTSLIIFIFVSYCFFAYITSVYDIVNANYLIVPIFISLILIIIISKRFVSKNIILLAIFLLYLGFWLYFSRTSEVGAFYGIFALLYFACFYWFDKVSAYYEVVKVSNTCYIIYLLISIICYYFHADAYRSVEHEHLPIRAFHGIEGTPASIDAFSVLVFLVNFLYNKSNNRFLFYLLSVITIFAAGSTTPYLMILVSMFSYLYLRVTRSAISMYFIFFISMLFVFYLSIHSEGLEQIIAMATNGRSLIWSQQIENMDWNIIYSGDMEAANVFIGWSNGSTNNSHNAFLFLVFRFGLILTSIFLFYLIIRIMKKSIHDNVLMMSFLAAGISSSYIFYIGNPYFLYILFFCISENKKLNVKDKRVIGKIPH